MELNVLEARNDREVHTFSFSFEPDKSYFENRIIERAEITGEYERDGDSDDIRISYRISYVVRSDCDACGEPAEYVGEAEGFEIVRKATENDRVKKASVKIDEEDDSYTYEGDSIFLDRIANEALALDLPSRIVCREDCKGLCPKCGKNLNAGDCGCTEDYSDSPFAKLLNLN